MVDVLARREFADALAALAKGAITNDEFESRVAQIRTNDRAIRAIFLNGAWHLYSDLSEHRLTGPHAVSRQTTTEIERWLLFLRTGLEYEWPQESRPASVLGVMLSMLTLGAWAKTKAITWRRAGVSEVWPFLRENDYAEAKKARLEAPSAP